MSTFNEIIDPQNFFPTFSDDDWIDWLLIGNWEEVLHIYHLCIDHDFQHKASITKSVLENWDTPWLSAKREDVRLRNTARLN